MKKTFFVILVGLFLLNLTSCVSPNLPAETPGVPEYAPTTPTPELIEEPETTYIDVFTDPVLEVLIRGSIGKPEGKISAAEAEAVTRLDLSNEWQRYFQDGEVIRELGGLEYFSNLESLDLSFHEISDISPLAGMANLTRLSLAGNPIADISPLAGLTNLKALVLSNCKVQDYTPLANLVGLELLRLDHSSISDVSPLAALVNLKYLYLGDSPINDIFALAEIYPNLEENDFIVPSTLQELGFTMNTDDRQAWFDSENATIRINRSLWGSPPREWEANCITETMYLNDLYKTSIGWYGDIDAYVFQMYSGGQMVLNYVYDSKTGEFSIGEGDRESSEQIIREVFDLVEGKDVLFAPIPFFEKVIYDAFGMSPNALYALPFEPPTLKSLGFFADKENAVCLYEQRGDWDYNLEFHRAEWGEKEFDVRFFTPISDMYRIVATYHIDANRIHFSVDDNNKGGAAFDFYLDTNEYVDEWCSEEGKTVEECLIKAYNDSAIENVYSHSVELMSQYYVNRFGMTFQEMYQLPGCE